MEEAGSLVNRGSIVLLFTLSIFGFGCKKCWNCEDVPNEVDQVIGDWDWLYTIRTMTDGAGFYYDTIHAHDYTTEVSMNLRTDGCLLYHVGNDEYHACMSVSGRTLTEESYLNYNCRERVQVLIEGRDMSFDGRLLALGYDCETMNFLTGGSIPFRVGGSGPFLVPPELPVGRTLEGYTNYFERKL